MNENVVDIVDIKNAEVYRGDTQVFDNLSLTIPGVGSTAILGPNGAGKSTLLKLLLREIHPVVKDGSYVKVFGRERWVITELRARLGVVSNELQVRYSPGALGLNVALSGYYSSIGTWGHQSFSAEQLKEADDIMDRLGILHLKEKQLARMSTGEQRRFLLARALINNPDTLILDEPTSGLDVPATFHYLGIIRDLIKEGRRLVLVTHHLHEIPPEVDHVVTIRKGRVLHAGPKCEVLTEANLKELFATDLQIVRQDGWYQVLPV